MKKHTQTALFDQYKKRRKSTFRVMTATFALLFICTFLSLSAKNYSQNTVVNIKKSNVEIVEVLQEIEKQSDYLFIYNNELDATRKVTVKATNQSVSELLTQLFDDTDTDYTLEGNHIVLRKKNSVVASTIQQNKRLVTGTVVDHNGDPVIGANVVEKGTTNGVITDVEGHFSISVTDQTILQISYIGYLPEEITVSNQTSISIILKEDTQALDEVVVVGYGTQKKVNLTGAVVTVQADVIENRPIKSVTDALQGTISGLTVQSGTGRPGDFSSYNIRGSSSVNSSGALVLIDGMPGDINQINPQDIQSISVLKDAASAAIYGARAAEGVVLVTTKDASSEKTKIEYSGNYSYNKPTRLPASNNALDHALLSNSAFINAGLAAQFPQEALDAIKNRTVKAIPKGNDWIYTDDVDWISLMMNKGSQQNHNLTISKAAKNLKYLFSAGWYGSDGLFSEYGPDNYDRVNLRSNIFLDIIEERLSLDSKMTYSSAKKLYHPQFAHWDIPYIVLIQSGPNMPIYDPNGNYARYRMQANPIQALREGGEATDKNQILEGVFSLNYQLIKDLRLKLIGGGTFETNQLKEWRRLYGKYGPDGLRSMGAGQAGPNRINLMSSTRQYFTGQFIADYNKTIGLTEISLLGGWSIEKNTYKNIHASRINIVGNELPALNLGSTEGWSNESDETEWALMSGFMRANYAYASKYLIEANFRADASSRFSSKKRWGIFPSVSLGWRVTEEGFMKNQRFFSNLKIRTSWGQLGNQNGLGLYDHIPQYVLSGYYPFQNELGQWALMQKLASENRTWETVEMINLAFDLGFLNNRLTLVCELFKKNNKDMLVNIEVPSVIGIEVPTGNYGELEVKGWEVSVGWTDRIKELNYSVHFNLSDQKDVLVDYGVKYSGFTSGVNQKIQGYSLGSIFGYETNGFFSSEEEVKNSAVINRSVVGVGDLKYIDQDGDGKISAPNDLKYLGTTTPRYVYGINFNLSWKNIDAVVFFQGVGKRNFYLSRHAVAPFVDTWGNYSYTLHNDYWSPENREAYLPRHYAGSNHNYSISDHWIQNAAYLRLKNLQVGYTFHKGKVKFLGISRLRFYFSGENLFEYSKLHENYDPELTNVDGFVYPILRSYSFGVNVTL